MRPPRKLDNKYEKINTASEYRQYFWILFVCFLLLLIWLAVYTGWSAFFINQLRSTSGTGGDVGYVPVIAGILNSTTVSLVGSTSSSSATVYQYVGLLKAGASLLTDSYNTPSTDLPAFSTSRTQVVFANGVVFENGDIVIHSYYPSNVITDGLQPLASVPYVYYESCFRDLSGSVLCWNGTNFCQYPVSVAGQTFDTLEEVLAYAQETINPNVHQNPSTGCYVTLIDPELANAETVARLTQNVTAASNGMIFLVDTQKGNRRFYLNIVDYTISLQESNYINISYPVVDFYIDYGDGTPVEHYQGIVNPVTSYHTYSVSAPATAYVTITGNVVGWNGGALYDSAGVPRNSMILDIVQWGDVNLQAAGFGYEQYMTTISAGSPPSTLQRTYSLFPYQSVPSVYANLETWDVSNFTMTIYMFYFPPVGTVLNISNWDLSNVVHADEMFYACTTANEIDTSRWVFRSLQTAKRMFYTANIGNINTATWDMRNIVIIQSIFQQYLNPISTLGVEPPENLIRNITGVEYWNVTNLQDASYMCYNTYACRHVDVSTWYTPSLIDVRLMFSGAGLAPVPAITNWNLQSLQFCNCFFKNIDDVSGLKLINADTVDDDQRYNSLLRDFYLKSNTTGLICNWGSNACSGFGQSYVPVNPLLLEFRTLLVERGWCIADAIQSSPPC